MSFLHGINFIWELSSIILLASLRHLLDSSSRQRRQNADSSLIELEHRNVFVDFALSFSAPEEVGIKVHGIEVVLSPDIECLISH